ncbi:hypothetical protein IMZ31_02020 [Pontibacillus sp. ALD_SL1]|uniref:hypothetical protein n=1 Tax=Pontibacillus sp. ALD_SL1 TaxID=2777185 RepID=UPI001A958CE4|nr:hypothetical protein [Pontibacillus sp. ALD_SL1]QST00396.1 hypothetical protein IMZ31_02020 [Pontibacillus sp. ALD_SL1]
MKFIEPKNKNSTKVDWDISVRIRAIVKYYAEYTEYSESEVVDMFLVNILNDEQFLEWIASKRNNKRILKQLEIEEKDLEDLHIG